MTTLTIIPRPATLPACVEVTWEPTIQNLYCTIRYPDQQRSASGATPLRDLLDARWPVAQPRRMIVAGQLSIGLDAEERLHDLDIRTDLAAGTVQPINRATEGFVQPYTQASFDDAGDAVCAAIEAALYDAEQGVVCLSWGPAHHWCAVAPTLALGLGADGALMKILVSDLRLPAIKPRPKRAWERLSKKFGRTTDSDR